MHTENIELLKDEAQRLLQLEMEFFEQMMAAKGVITEAEAGLQQTFDRTSTPKHIEVLKGEHTKLENMELVIAVVGTMKAGKSTTINAIVGTEVLPNRNRPMTAIPTLIRHTPGQINPVLKFDNNAPINELHNTLYEVITNKKINNEELTKLASEKDMGELIDNISNQQVFCKIYEGADDIFMFLKTLNDLVRLSTALKVEFPFSSYTNVDQMPVIQVEFAHLREAGQAQGQLTLLDTPGPNEAGQDHLRNMLNEQLKKTSAVLAVFDYTQLKSDADEHVRTEIKHIARLHAGRLFALVNKFDQKDRNGDEKEATQTLVAEILMEGLIETRHVFPVSSMWGYLANRARHEITIHQALPDPNQEPWVEDFANAAFGPTWEKNDIQDKDEVLKKASALWNKSGFHDPMENVIRIAHAQAALLSIDSAAEKLTYYANEIENFIGLRRGALSQSANALQQRIIDLKGDIEEVESIEKDVQNKIESIFKGLKGQTQQTVSNAKNKIEEKMVEYFKEGKRAEKEEHLAKQKKPKNEKNSNEGMFFWGRASEDNRDFDPNEKTITLNSEDKVIDLVKKIKKSIENEIEDQREYLDREIVTTLETFLTDFSEIVKSAEKLISGINSDMINEGFNINLKFPDTHKLNAIFRKNDLSLTDKVDHQTRTERYEVKKSGAWGATARFFGKAFSDSWGYESRTREVDEYIIDVEKIRHFVNSTIDKIFRDYELMMKKTIIEPLKSEVDIFFMGLRKTIEDIRGNLQQGIRDQQSGKEEVDALTQCLDRFLDDVPGFTKDTEALGGDIKLLKDASMEV